MSSIDQSDTGWRCVQPLTSGKAGSRRCTVLDATGCPRAPGPHGASRVRGFRCSQRQLTARQSTTRGAGRRRRSGVRGARLRSWRPQTPARTATRNDAAVASRCRRWSLPASRRPPRRTAPPNLGHGYADQRGGYARGRGARLRVTAPTGTDSRHDRKEASAGATPYLRSARAQARRHGIPPMPCRTLNRSARIRRPPLPRLRRLRRRARPDAWSLPPTPHPAQAPPSPTKLRPTPRGATGGRPSSPGCSRSRSSSRSSPCQTSSPDTPSPATANRRRSSAPRRTKKRKQARRRQ